MKKYLVVAERASDKFQHILHKDDVRESACSMASFFSEKFPHLSHCVYELCESGEKKEGA